MKNSFIFILFILCSSCGSSYKHNFDCPPSPGIPCTSVSEIQKMIIETPEGGPDIFTGKIPSNACEKCNRKRCRVHSTGGDNAQVKRIWVSGCDCGDSKVEGHFIYFERSCNPEGNVQ